MHVTSSGHLKVFLLFAQPLMISSVNPWRSPFPSLKGNVIWYITRNQETEERDEVDG